MSKLTEEEKEFYSSADLPKPKNIFLYCYRIFVKVIFCLIFAVGAVILGLIVFPFIRLFSGFSKQDFGEVARRYVSHTFRVFLNVLEIFGCIKLKTDSKTKGKNCEYRNIHKKVIVANHPSLLDFVYIMSLVPNSTCIVRGGLTKTPLAGVINQAYITNTTTFDEICRECKKVIDDGNNVIIFPEGTRTPRHGNKPYQRGAARIARYCNADILPIFIGGSDKYGLGKNDSFFSYNRSERYFYDFKRLPEIKIKDYADLSEPIAAKRITEKIREVIILAAEEYKNNHPDCVTLNNV